MRLGLHIGYWGLGLTAQEQLELVLEAERLGYDSVWTAEAYGSDAATILAWLAQATTRIKLGSAIFQMPGRSAAMTAMTAATIDQLSDGRMLLGIGTSGPQVAEGWHGQRFGKQLQRTREYVAVVRMALARERVVFKGETLELPLPDGPGKALQADDRAGAGADADLPRRDRAEEHDARRRDRRRLDPDAVLARARRRVPPAARGGLRARRRRQGLRRLRHRAHGQRRSSPTTSTPRATRCAPTSRSTSAAWARASRTSTTRSSSATGSRTPRARSRTSTSTASARRRWRRCPAELLDKVSLTGPPDVVRERLAIFRDAGVGTLMVSPMAWTLDERREQLRLVAELAA